jgi:hypothetical protein
MECYAEIPTMGTMVHCQREKGHRGAHVARITVYRERPDRVRPAIRWYRVEWSTGCEL